MIIKTICLIVGLLYVKDNFGQSTEKQYGPVDSVIIFGVPINDNGNERITSLFGWRKHPILGCYRLHNGVDIAVKGGTPVMAVADGLVETSGMDNTGLGYFVKLSHGSRLETLYGHLFCFFVKAGDMVIKGQVIGLVGKTGMATGYHLHFILKKEGVAIDPLPFFTP